MGTQCGGMGTNPGMGAPYGGMAGGHGMGHHHGGMAGGYPYGGMGAAQGYGYGDSGWGAGYARSGLFDSGLLQNMPAFLQSRNAEQFLLGAVIGAAAAWVLADEELRGKLIKAGMKVYAGIAGGFEEMKEQMSDIKAEVAAEQRGEG